jgi:hypothetical protein
MDHQACILPAWGSYSSEKLAVSIGAHGCHASTDMKRLAYRAQAALYLVEIDTGNDLLCRRQVIFGPTRIRWFGRSPVRALTRFDASRLNLVLLLAFPVQQ